MRSSNSLTVYKASAGSGKTFTLATEYIRLLVEDPSSYRHILAVTFTNKATEEMKMRILSQLYGICHRLPDSGSYLNHICQRTGLEPQLVSQRAGEALRLLLHNYNYFRVETIDTFFQSVLRNLARELDLTANLRVGLNDVQVEEEAVDQLIDSLTHSDVMLQWILKYIMENIGEDRSWNIIAQVKQFGRTIFRDFYKEHSRALHEKAHDEHFFDAYARQMQQIRQAALQRMQQWAAEFMETLEAEGLTIDGDLTYGKAGVGGFFLKLQNGVMDESIVGKRVADAADDPAKWCKKTHRRAAAIQALAESTLIPLLRKAIEDRPRQWRLYKSADLTLRHLNQLRLLGSIEQKVRQLNEEANRFLLSDTQQLLHALIKDSDSPFIFEKIGTQLDYIMIDEFQDTSTVQWQNFKVLLQECLSHADSSGSLIVGDVKQSIYRWRSGDWRLLNAIDREIPHADRLMQISTLDTNYRSERHIVEFNNAFFEEAARQEHDAQQEEYPHGAQQLEHAYSDVAQKLPDGKASRGMVSVRLLPRADYQQQTLSLLADTVAQLIDSGAQPASIAILVRTNNLIPLIADYFAAHLPTVHIVSDEAFRLSASVAVSIIVEALHLLTHPDDQLSRATVAKLYQRIVMGNKEDESLLFNRQRSLDSLLPEAFTDHTDQLLRLPLYDLAERLYAIFHLDRLGEQSSYVCAFYDQLARYTQDHTADIDGFVTQWQDNICRKTIQSAETEGIRMLSIHKSKGLEFDHVIIPFCDWRLEHPDVLWCQPREAPFDAMPIVPIDYSEKQMRGTIYEHDYLDEHLQNTVDNLNLLYVAFTRASKNLFVIGRRKASGTRSTLIESVLPQLKLEGSTLQGMTAGDKQADSDDKQADSDDEQTTIDFSYGTLYIPDHSVNDKEPTKNVFLQPVTPVSVSVETFAQQTSFRQSNRSRDFIADEASQDGHDNDTQDIGKYIKTGSVLHEIFSTIRTTDDIDQALARLQFDGIIYDDEITRDRLAAMLRKRLAQKQVSEWFSSRWRVFNECTILRVNADGHTEERRPDRVITDGQTTHVIDFKFGKPHDDHQAQVGEYMQLLRQMGMPHVQGWLWYVYSNQIVECR